MSTEQEGAKKSDAEEERLETEPDNAAAANPAIESGTGAEVEQKTDLTEAPGQVVAEPEGEEKSAEEGAKIAKEGKPKKKEGEGEGEVVEEKTITVNLRHAHLAYSRKPAPRSVRLVKKIASKTFHTEDVKIDNSLNSLLWSRGKTKAVCKITLRIQKMDDDSVRVLPATIAEAAGA